MIYNYEYMHINLEKEMGELSPISDENIWLKTILYTVNTDIARILTNKNKIIKPFD